MKVLLDIDEETLKWAAHQAVELGISRKEFLKRCIEEVQNSKPNIQLLKPIHYTPGSIKCAYISGVAPYQSFKKKEDE